jgi:hypothetical protein
MNDIKHLSKVDQIEHLVSGILMERCKPIATSTAKAIAMIIADAMVDNHIIGLPNDATRTSVGVALIDEIGKMMHCKAGEDADDICRAVIHQVGE